MKRLFVSQPMRGHTSEDILAKRSHLVEVAKKILGEDVELIDSYIIDVPEDTTPLYCLGRSLELLSTADVIIFSKDYKIARGCAIEYLCASLYDIDIILEDDSE